MRTGRAAITEPITLVQASGKRARAFLILLLSTPPPAVVGAAVAGWSYAPVLIDEVLGVQWPQEQLWVEWRDSPAVRGRHLLPVAWRNAPTTANPPHAW